MDVFFDDWKALATEDSTFGSKSDNHLKVRYFNTSKSEKVYHPF